MNRIAETWDEVADHVEAGGLVRTRSRYDDDDHWCDRLVSNPASIRSRYGAPGHDGWVKFLLVDVDDAGWWS